MLDAVNQQERLLTLNIHKEPGIDFDFAIPGLKLWPLFLDPEGGTWVLYASYAPGTKLAKHFHSGAVHFFTTKGIWGYLEHPEDMQTPGSYLYEPAGTTHTFGIPENGERVEGFMVVTGVNVNFDADGKFIDVSHAGSMEQAILYAAKQQGIDMPRYIRPSGKIGFTA